MGYKFGLRDILLDLEWKSYGQRFIITLIAYFTSVGFENTSATNLVYNYYILWNLDFKLLGLQISVTIIRFYWIWTWKYLGCDLGL